MIKRSILLCGLVMSSISASSLFESKALDVRGANKVLEELCPTTPPEEDSLEDASFPLNVGPAFPPVLFEEVKDIALFNMEQELGTGARPQVLGFPFFGVTSE